MAIIYFYLSDYGNNGGKEGRLWHNVGWKPHYMAIPFAKPLYDRQVHHAFRML